MEFTSPDDSAMAMSLVDGDFNAVFHPELTESSVEINLEAVQQFNIIPELRVFAGTGDSYSYSFSQNGNDYSHETVDDISNEGVMMVETEDLSSNAFFFTGDYSIREFADTSTGDGLFGGDSPISIFADSIGGLIARAMFLSTDYPPPVNGLEESYIRVSDVYSVALYPEIELPGSSGISISYSEQLIGSSLDELDVRLFRWDYSSEQWILMGGTVDTVINKVSAVIDSSGTYAAYLTDIATGIEDQGDIDQLPEKYGLDQNIPNPFNPRTTINFQLPTSADVRLDIYNILGQSVKSLVQRELPAGEHQVRWNGTDENGVRVASGIYFYRLQADEFVQTRKMLLLK
jgi:hypothetical protein